MEQVKLFIELTRLKKPIGYMLLFWPCAWGLTLAYDFDQSIYLYIYYMILFFTGSILMRSAGCIVNDILDREYDAKVSRTKNRPIALKKISVKLGFFYSSALCLVALFVLIQFNWFTILLALISMPFAFTYPLMKRFTYWPQLFLGVTFNYGLVLGWTSIEAELSISPLIFYLGAVFWTLGFDTIYGYQDIADDEIIGLKSTSIKFKDTPKTFLYFCYTIFLTILFLIGVIMELSLVYFFVLTLVIYHLYFLQINRFNKNDYSKCLEIFKSNNFLGLIILVALISGKTIII